MRAIARGNIYNACGTVIAYSAGAPLSERVECMQACSSAEAGIGCGRDLLQHTLER